MTVKVLAFGIIKEIFSGSSAEIQVPDRTTAADLKAALEQHYPRLRQLAGFMMAVNNEYASGDAPVNERDEIALIPPVSGG